MKDHRPTQNTYVNTDVLDKTILELFQLSLTADIDRMNRRDDNTISFKQKYVEKIDKILL